MTTIMRSPEATRSEIRRRAATLLPTYAHDVDMVRALAVLAALPDDGTGDTADALLVEQVEAVWVELGEQHTREEGPDLALLELYGIARRAVAALP